jgi:hypothetical protein
MHWLNCQLAAAQANDEGACHPLSLFSTNTIPCGRKNSEALEKWAEQFNQPPAELIAARRR